MLSPAEAGRNEHVEAIARYLLGRVALARGAVIEAEGHLHEAMAIAARRDFRPQTLNAVESLAHVAALAESPEEAARLLAAVRRAREHLGMVRWRPERELWAAVEEEVRSASEASPRIEARAPCRMTGAGRFDYPHGRRNSPPSSVRVKDARNSTRS